MDLSTRRHPLTASIMALVMLLTSLPLGVAKAGMVSTKAIIEQEQAVSSTELRGTDSVGQAQREHLRDVLARGDVQREMVALGIAPAEAEARIAALTDQEIADIAGRLDQLPAGEGVGSILVIIFIVFGVAVMLDALGMMNIFPFVCGPGECVAANNVQAYAPEPVPESFGNEPYGYDDRRSYYRRDQSSRDQFGDRSDRRSRRDSFSRQEGFDSNQYYEPQAQAPTRNYYEERFGAQRPVR